MPTFRYSQSYVTRGAGKSVVATAAYYAAENLRQQGRGEAQANAAYQSGENLKASGRAFNFENKAGGVLHKEILAPEGAPEWAGDRQELWNRVDASEAKKNARLARKLVISLPSELSVEQNVALVRDFLKEQFVSQGIVADFAIHAPDHDGDSRHIHAHVLLTRRELRPEGFGKLFRSAEQGAALANDRKAWEGKVNDALERAGVHDRVSADSLYARGIVREPEPVLGDKAIEEERRQKHSKRGSLDERTQKRMRQVADIRERNARRAEYDRKGEAHPRDLMEHYWRGRDRWMEQQQKRIDRVRARGNNHFAGVLEGKLAEAKRRADEVDAPYKRKKEEGRPQLSAREQLDRPSPPSLRRKFAPPGRAELDPPARAIAAGGGRSGSGGGRSGGGGGRGSGAGSAGGSGGAARPTSPSSTKSGGGGSGQPPDDKGARQWDPTLNPRGNRFDIGDGNIFVSAVDQLGADLRSSFPSRPPVSRKALDPDEPTTATRSREELRQRDPGKDYGPSETPAGQEPLAADRLGLEGSKRRGR